MSGATDKNLRERALRISTDNLFQIDTKETAYPLVPFNNSLTRPFDLNVNNVFQNNVRYAANVALGNVIATGGVFDIQIPAKSVQIADKVTLQFTVTNGSGAPTTLVNTIQMIDNIEIWAKNTSVRLTRIEGDYLYCLSALYNSEEWDKRARLMNITGQWGNGTAVPAGNTVNYFVPLEGTLFNQAKLNIEQINGDWTIRVQFRPFSMTNAAAGSAPVLQDAAAIINQVNLDSLDSARKRNMYASNTVAFRYLDAFPQKFLGQALQPSSRYEYTLTALNGLVSHMFIFVRASGAVGNNLKNFQAIQSFDIADPSGASIINYQQTSEFNLFHEYPEIFPYSNFPGFNNVYCYAFAVSPGDNYENGLQTGFYPFTSNERLIINTPSTLVGGAFDIVVYPVSYRQVKIVRGDISTNI